MDELKQQGPVTEGAGLPLQMLIIPQKKHLLIYSFRFSFILQWP